MRHLGDIFDRHSSLGRVMRLSGSGPEADILVTQKQLVWRHLEGCRKLFCTKQGRLPPEMAGSKGEQSLSGWQ